MGKAMNDSVISRNKNSQVYETIFQKFKSFAVNKKENPKFFFWHFKTLPKE